MTLFQKLPYNLLCIIIAQAMAMIITIMFYSFAPIVGQSLIHESRFANLPIAISLLAMVSATIPFGWLSQHKGRRPVFIIGNISVVLSGLLFYLGVSQHSINIFCIGAIFLGVSSAAMSFYRFAAMEIVPKQQQSFAISSVMLVGVFAALIAPNLAIYTRNLLSDDFSASFALMIPLGFIALAFVLQIKWPDLPHKEKQQDSIKIQWQSLWLPIIIAALAYFAMTLLMNATPLHMHNLDYNFSDTAWVIQWHMIGMFAPSIFTGILIKKYGLNNLIILGALLLLVSILLNIFADSKLLLTIGLTLLGIGWNFTFIGASQWLVRASSGQAQAKIQGINDFIVFGFSIFASAGSSWLLVGIGWQSINELMLIMPIIIIILSVKNIRKKQ